MRIASIASVVTLEMRFLQVGEEVDRGDRQGDPFEGPATRASEIPAATWSALKKKKKKKAASPTWRWQPKLAIIPLSVPEEADHGAPSRPSTASMLIRFSSSTASWRRRARSTASRSPRGRTRSSVRPFGQDCPEER